MHADTTNRLTDLQVAADERDENLEMPRSQAALQISEASGDPGQVTHNNKESAGDVIFIQVRVLFQGWLALFHQETACQPRFIFVRYRIVSRQVNYRENSSGPWSHAWLSKAFRRFRVYRKWLNDVLITMFSPQEMTWDDKMEKRHNERSKRLWDYCKTSKLDQLEYRQIGGNVIVSEKHKMMWCIVPKVGSNQWKDVMGKLENLEHIPKDIFTRAGFKYFPQYQPEKQREMLRTYHRFMFVRHPFERLLSAYRDKFVKKSPAFLKIFGRAIIRRYRQNATDYALETGDGVTFPEFTRYVSNLRWNYFDFHWRPFFRQCHACVIPYNYVGHFETYKEDADYILKRAGVDHLVEFPPLHGSDTTSELLEHYADVPKETIMKLFDTYRDDLAMFDYPFPGPLRVLLEQSNDEDWDSTEVLNSRQQ